MSQPKGPTLCVLGSVNMDLVVRTPRLPRPGETILGGPFEEHPGGKGANQAVAAARMGARVSFIGAVGEDAYGSALRGALEAEGIDTGRLATRAGARTGVGLIAVAADGENSIIVASGANHTVTEAEVGAARDALFSADALLMQLETGVESVLAGAALAREVGTLVILNAAPAAELPRALLAMVDVLIVNEEEGAALSRGSGIAVSGGLSGLGVQTVVMTLGAAGVRYWHGRAEGDVAAYRVEAVDTVGAGDAFVGAFATRWCELMGVGALDEAGVRDAMCWGAAAGALAATKRGAIPSLPRRGEVVGLLRGAAQG